MFEEVLQGFRRDEDDVTRTFSSDFFDDSEIEFVPQEGTRISHYEVLSHVGKGGSAYVVKARDVLNERILALKIIKAMENPEKRKLLGRRLSLEAKVQARLDATDFGHFASVIENITDGTNRAIAMTLISGNTLSELLNEEVEFDLEKVLKIVLEIAIALNSMHKLGFIHRDLKPGNIMLAEDGRVVLLDFGLVSPFASITCSDFSNDSNPSAMQNDSSRFLSRELTITGEFSRDGIVGTPSYIAPEAIASPELVDCRADLYGLGIIFYELLSGRYPYGKAKLEIEAFKAHLRQSPKPLSEHVPEPIRKMVFRLLEKDPEKRYQSAKDFVADLIEYMYPNSVVERIKRFFERMVRRNLRGLEDKPILIIGEGVARI